MKEKSKKEEIKVTAEEQLLIFKGVRPEEMDQVVFNKVRKDLNKSKKLYSKGKYKHFSVNLGVPIEERPAQGTYVRTEPKRWEKLNRKWQRDLNNTDKKAVTG